MPVLNFHRVEDATGLEITRLSPRRFERVMDEFDPTDASIQITFDDGFASICDNALPLLKKRGHRAILFLITDAIGRDDSWDVRVLGRARPMMDWNQVREWSNAGIEFGSHSHSHRDLTALSPRWLRHELVDSKARIEDATGHTVSYFSYPFGRHSRAVRDAVRQAGYQAAYAIDGIPDDQFSIPRVNVHALMSVFELRRILRGGRPSWPTRLFTTLSAGSATMGNWRGRRDLTSEPLNHEDHHPMRVRAI